MKSAIFINQSKYIEHEFEDERELEHTIKTNSQLLFGSKTIYFDLKNRIESKSLGATIPDAFLIDFSEKENPDFYLVEIELAKHDFYRHIFPQITKFFAFFKNSENQNKLIGRLFDLIKSDDETVNAFKKHIGEEIYKELKDMIEESPNILLILDENKPELKEVTETYTDTWGKMVKIEILKRYSSEGKQIFTITPDFGYIELMEEEAEQEIEKGVYDEHYHLEGVDEHIIAVYNKIKSTMSEFDPSIHENPQKYYISLRKNKNFTYITFRKHKLRVVIMLPIEKGKEIIKNHKLLVLSDSIQKFYHEPCFEVFILNQDNLEEIIKAIKEAYALQK